MTGTTVPSPSDSLTIALSLARFGFPVFPVRLVTADNGKTDKRPLVRWLEGATTDPEQIATWWSLDFPDAWVGVHAARSGIVIVDVDVPKKNDTRDGAKALKAAGLKLPKTFAYKTRSGGAHHVYRAPDGIDLAPKQDAPVDGVDMRGGNGLMVYYGPELESAPDIAPAPKWVVDAAIKTSASYARGEGDIDKWLDMTRKGKPSDAVKAAESVVTRQGMTHADMLAAISGLIKLKDEPGIGDAYLRARSVYLTDYPADARSWDKAASGSIHEFGDPITHLPISKAERKQIKQLSTPEAVEQRKTDRRADFSIAMNVERVTKTVHEAGKRSLEDGPLAEELTESLQHEWAWTDATRLIRYDGKVWRRSDKALLVEAVRRALKKIQVQEHKALTERDAPKAVIAKTLSLLGLSRARNVSEFVVGILMEQKREADAFPDLLNAQNGIVDLKTGELLPHDPSYMFTKIAGAAYLPGARSADWGKALEAFPPSILDWVQVRFGQACTGRMLPDAQVLILKGGGENGKSAVLNGIRGALGDFFGDLPAELLVAAKGAHPTELMTLRGIRFAVAEELPANEALNTQRLKAVAGTPTITARLMRADFVTFNATHTMMVTTNESPRVAASDHGSWRRLLMVPLPYTYRKPGEKLRGPRDRHGDLTLRERLLETPDEGALAWMVEGARRWYAAGQSMPKPPKAVRKAMKQFRENGDPLMKFVNERLEEDPKSAVWVKDMLDEFNAWQLSEGSSEWSARTFTPRFESHESVPNMTRGAQRFTEGGYTLSRPVTRSLDQHRPAPPARADYWRGVRFKTDVDPTDTTRSRFDKIVRPLSFTPDEN